MGGPLVSLNKTYGFFCFFLFVCLFVASVGFLLFFFMVLLLLSD